VVHRAGVYGVALTVAHAVALLGFRADLAVHLHSELSQVGQARGPYVVSQFEDGVGVGFVHVQFCIGGTGRRGCCGACRGRSFSRLFSYAIVECESCQEHHLHPQELRSNLVGSVASCPLFVVRWCQCQSRWVVFILVGLRVRARWNAILLTCIVCTIFGIFSSINISK